MRYHYASHDYVFCTAATLIAFAWSASMRDLAARVRLSDVGFKKLLVGYGIPPRRKGTGTNMRRERLCRQRHLYPPRVPGQHPLLCLPARFASEVKAADPLSPDGPFPSPAVPDDLAEVRALQLRKIGNVTASRDLKSPHAAIRTIHARDEKYRAAKTNDRWAVHSPSSTTPSTCDGCGF